MFFTFCVCVSGLVAGYRTKLHRKIFFRARERALPKNGTVPLAIVAVAALGAALSVPSPALKMICFSLLFSLFPLSARWLLRWRRKRKFERMFRLFLNQIILIMSCGKSFRQSFRESVLYFDRDLQKIFGEIFEIVTFSQQLSNFSGSVFEKRVLDKFIAVDKSPRNSLDQLRSFRVELELTEFFRRRSGQVTGAVRFQALLISILYFFLLAFVLSEFGWAGNRMSIGLSVALYSAGLAVFYYLGRKKRWKL